MKKILALVLAMVMMLALVACGGGAEEAAAPVEAAPAAAPAAAPDAAAPVEAAPAAEDTWTAWKEYAAAYATAGAPTEEEKTSVAEAIRACATYEEVTEIAVMDVLLQNLILPYQDWLDAGMPEADLTNVTAGDPGASGEASGEASEEPAA